jgi:glycosyltransferase involved in cell wall biosynthesis
LESGNIFFSIIIPCYNRALLIEDTIRSIIDQGFESVEIIIVDDGSQDNTLKVIKTWLGRRVKYIRTENRERGAARNTGLKEAMGLYVNYFDSDDIMNSCLKQVSDFILKSDCPPVVYGAIESITTQGKSIVHAPRPYSDFKRSIIHNNFLACGAVFLRKDIAYSFLFSEDRKLSGTEDWELWLRVYSAHNFAECPVTIFKQRHHALRSLNNASADQITERENSFISHITSRQDLLQKRFSGFAIDLLIADRYTLIALAQMEAGDRERSTKSWVKSFRTSFGIVVRKRFWAVGKKILLPGV